MVEVPKKEDIEEIIKWCEEEKKRRGISGMVVENPFREKMDWARAFAFIEIDRPFSVASKISLVYHSPSRTLYRYFANGWVPVEAE